ncbi:hypothetical protein Kpol_411p9 [Vanderwaltozyma polyspora DSM 70294]|uniref:Aminopeptidase P N-terminal domain-containing protein n=1 Tax=Vanderwaltozyma polyspora (strain ATCC 22028 / DSM 70294 / BCRC 21397 / CBS 2163 / NBRC 10782 / NRRL Y-8283 / UCD 57-17) TaxID=436907 RepID=A7TRP2_VANPO|nr:uncharacterized protein Kpol_411p9 [Vanderwaltozyma polyspora DSM 70294]EDO15064.1 hypothetical protein Kpol_411p9 [Vanderwaltozyma polyspora DSM 70294]
MFRKSPILGTVKTVLAYRRFYASDSSQFINRVQSPIQAGQALYETRPHLLKAGEVTPGITALEYFERRVNLANSLPQRSCAIIVGNQIKYASGPVFYPFQQNNDLYYLSGWNEPDSVMILEKPDDNIDNIVFHMIVRGKDAFAEKWEGFRTGTTGAKEIFNADESVDLSQLSPYITKVIKRNDNIYYNQSQNEHAKNSSSIFSTFFSLPEESKHTTNINSILKMHGTGKKIKELNKVIAPMRRIKSPAELRVMRRAGQISGRAFNQAMAKRFRNERTLHSYLEYKFISGGCDKPAYIPVVATGSNALCIHYTRNNDVMYDDEMVLVDASGALGGYCTDISRTWPVSGKFSQAQKDVYEAVLNVQRKCIELCKASNGVSLHDIHEESVDYMLEELRNAGLNGINRADVNALYPHYIGHNLGLDVHDIPSITRHGTLKPGQVITIEPGVYIPDDSNYPPHYRNIGIRIEDDIAIGTDTYTNLTVEAVKEVADLENVMQNGVTTIVEEDVLESL